MNERFKSIALEIRVAWLASHRAAFVYAAMLVGLGLLYRVDRSLGQFLACLIALFILGRAVEKWHSFSGYVVFTLCVLIAKLALVSGNEIAAEHTDAWAYVATANGHPWSAMGPSSGYPIWLSISMAIGIPQRIAIEVLFVFSSVFFSVAFGRFPFGFIGYALLLLLTVFSPASYFLFDRALSDGFYICLSMIAVAASVITLQTERQIIRRIALLTLGVALGMMALTRKEDPLLLAAMLSLAVLSIITLVRLEKLTLKKACLITLYRVGLSSVVALCMVGSVLFLHWKAEGVWAQNSAELPGHKKLLANLAAIKVQSPHQRFVPVSREARLLAYQNSPTLNRLSSIIESPENPYGKESLRVLGMPGEIGAGWIWHTFNDAAAKYGIKKTIELEQFYDQINLELDTAFRAGKLSKEFVFHPLLGSDFSVWLPFVGEGFSHVLLGTTRALEPRIDVAFDADLFDLVCLRRKALIQKNEGVIKAWAFSERNNISRILVQVETTNGGAVSEGTQILRADQYARPDVQEAFRKQGKSIPLNTGFAARIPLSTKGSIRLQFVLDDGQIVIADHLVENRVRTITATNGGAEVVLGIDTASLENQGFKKGRNNEMMQAAVALYWRPFFWYGVLSLAVTGIALFAWRARAVSDDKHAFICLISALLILSWILCRLGFYAVMDAAAWGAEPRYLLVSGIFLIALSVGALGIFKRKS